MKRFDSRSSEKRSEKNDISHNFARNLNKGVFVEMIKLEKIFLAFFSFFSKGKKYLCFFGGNVKNYAQNSLQALAE